MKESKNSPEWEQVSIAVEESLAEQLSVLLGEILPGGVVLEKNVGDLFPHEVEYYQGPVRLLGYFQPEMRQEIEEQIIAGLKKAGLGELLGQVEFTALSDRNWETAWQERYRPLAIGKRLVVVPSWLDNPFPDRIPIWMDPGMAFGSGTHPTTQLSLSLLEKTLRKSSPEEMIDIGCGSGILSIAAVKLGVKHVLGVDEDPVAVRVSTGNAQANAISGSARFEQGSVKDLLGEGNSFQRATLVVANIIAPVLIDLFDEGLGDLVLPDGRIILSGILQDQLPRILLCLEQAGFVLAVKSHQDDWVGLIADKRSAL